jgi:hippurate hydrolase
MIREPNRPLRRFCFSLFAVAAVLLPAPAGTSGERPGRTDVEELKQRIAKDYAHLDRLYKHLHAHPELAEQEVKTAARMADELRQAGFTVTEKVGGTGVVALLKNGDGPVVMVRADMDGLPVVEKTGVPYASKVTTRDWEG